MCHLTVICAFSECLCSVYPKHDGFNLPSGVSRKCNLQVDVVEIQHIDKLVITISVS